MEVLQEELNRMLSNLCRIHPSGGQAVVEHLIRCLTPKEFKRVAETISREAWLIQLERHRHTPQQEPQTDIFKTGREQWRQKRLDKMNAEPA